MNFLKKIPRASSFLIYTENILLPSLLPGDILIMDNLSVYYHAGAIVLLEKNGIKVEFCLPTVLILI